MIKIKVDYNNHLIEQVTMSGHAEYDVHGKDIVCSAVSSIAITTENAIQRLRGEVLDTNVDDGYLYLKTTNDDAVVQELLNNMIELFKQLETQYPEYIKIKI